MESQPSRLEASNAACEDYSPRVREIMLAQPLNMLAPMRVFELTSTAASAIGARDNDQPVEVGY